MVKDPNDGKTTRHERAKARIRVASEMRGTLPANEFDLIGGPIDSCAFFDVYLTFEVGRRLFLFLEDPVPEDTRAIEIFRAPHLYWRGRADVERSKDRRYRFTWDFQLTGKSLEADVEFEVMNEEVGAVFERTLFKDLDYPPERVEQ